MGRKIDLTGREFERLSVISEAGRDKHGEVLWLCDCICGNIKIIRSSSLRSGISRSCGCLRREKSTTHNLTRDPLYRIWATMKNKCYNPKSSGYKWYGARGIIVCSFWLNNAETFIIWAKVNGWKKGLQIDRKNNDLGYTPKNCRFVSNRKNSLNTRLLRSTNTSGFRGVYQRRRKELQKYLAAITIHGKQKHLGLFDDPIEAAQAYDREAKKLGYPMNLKLQIF